MLAGVGAELQLNQKSFLSLLCDRKRDLWFTIISIMSHIHVLVIIFWNFLKIQCHLFDKNHIFMHTCINMWRVNLKVINFVQFFTWVTERHKPAFCSEHCVHCIFKPNQKRWCDVKTICFCFLNKRVLHNVNLQKIRFR